MCEWNTSADKKSSGTPALGKHLLVIRGLWLARGKKKNLRTSAVYKRFHSLKAATMFVNGSESCKWTDKLQKLWIKDSSPIEPLIVIYTWNGPICQTTNIFLQAQADLLGCLVLTFDLLVCRDAHFSNSIGGLKRLLLSNLDKTKTLCDSTL